MDNIISMMQWVERVSKYLTSTFPSHSYVAIMNDINIFKYYWYLYPLISDEISRDYGHNRRSSYKIVDIYHPNFALSCSLHLLNFYLGKQELHAYQRMLNNVSNMRL